MIHAAILTEKGEKLLHGIHDIKMGMKNAGDNL